jgi:hypothetical protein
MEFMVVLPRSEIRRAQLVGILSSVLSVVVIGGIVSVFADASPLGQVPLTLLGLVAVAAIGLSLMQLLSHRGASRALIFHEGDHYVVATNFLHEGYKLRFFRDILNEKIVSFSDAERDQWSALERVGYHAVFSVRDVRKPVLLPLCFMVFDEVFVVDHNRRWDYFNSKNTSEPTFSDRGVGPFDLDAVLPQSQSGPSSS